MSAKIAPKEFLVVKLKTNDSTKSLCGFFRAAGISMPNKLKAFYIIYAFIINVITNFITPMTFTLYYFIGSEEIQINEFLTSLHVGIAIYCSGIKLTVVAVNRGFLSNIEAILDKLDARIKYPEEIFEVQQVIRLGKRIVSLYFYSYLIYSTVTLVAAVYMERPPYSLYIPYLDWRESKWNFAIVSAIQYFMMNAIILQQILIIRVQRIGTDSKFSQEDNTHALIQCINDHKKILEIANILKPIMSATYFIQFIATTMSLGATLINISISNDRSTLIASALFMMGLIIEVLPICYFVNSFIAESERLPVAIFYTNWMGQSMEFRQLCLLFMHRSQSRLTFYAGKMFPITIDSFLVIIKYSFSVYTLLNNMDIGKRFNKLHLT